jgi:hypothetical protein
VIDDECEEWVGWLDIPPKRVIRVRGIVRRVDVPTIPVDDEVERRVEALARRHEPTTGAKTPLTRDEARELLAEGKRAADEKRKAREARERDPERAR